MVLLNELLSTFIFFQALWLKLKPLKFIVVGECSFAGLSIMSMGENSLIVSGSGSVKLVEASFLFLALFNFILDRI
jgi:hypothetical protein